MSQDYIRLSKKQVAFLMSKYETTDPDEAVEKLVESLVIKGIDPMLMSAQIDRMMARENN